MHCSTKVEEKSIMTTSSLVLAIIISLSTSIYMLSSFFTVVLSCVCYIQHLCVWNHRCVVFKKYCLYMILLPKIPQNCRSHFGFHAPCFFLVAVFILTFVTYSCCLVSDQTHAHHAVWTVFAIILSIIRPTHIGIPAAGPAFITEWIIYNKVVNVIINL